MIKESYFKEQLKNLFYIVEYNATLNTCGATVSNIQQPQELCASLGTRSIQVYSLSFSFADLNWPEEQSTSIRYL